MYKSPFYFLSFIFIGKFFQNFSKNDLKIGTLIKNQWKKVSSSDYENHMKFDSVMQLQAMNEIMKIQRDTDSISSVITLGITGDKGLKYIQEDKSTRV